MRTLRGLSAHKYGNLLGVTGRQVERWEHGDSEPQLRYLLALADLEKVSLDHLVGRSGLDHLVGRAAAAPAASAPAALLPALDPSRDDPAS